MAKLNKVNTIFLEVFGNLPAGLFYSHRD